MANALDGFLVMDKPPGLTSQQMVYRVKKALRIKKAGHTGTLDPLATGVLPVAIGEATKVISYLDEAQKVYRVEGRLGEETDTYDADGTILAREDCQGFTDGDLKDALNKFTGEISQVPPTYSAVKKDGKPLYRYARQGKPQRAPARKIYIEQIDLEAFQLPYFQLKVFCSRGTYIRSLIHDLGKQLGCLAHVTALRRLKTGPFEEFQAVQVESLREELEGVREKILPIEDCLPSLPKLDLGTIDQLTRVQSGILTREIQAQLAENSWRGRTVGLSYLGKIHALVRKTEQGPAKFQRVLCRNS